MTKRKLPIGIQTFREIREEGCYYVDKTAYACRLVDEGKHYFLSRPRRFGKSLLVDTLKELFEGNEPLFRGLAVHDRWDWSVRHPVVRLDFSGRNFTESGHLDLNLAAQLDAMERRAGVGTPYPAGPERFGHLLETLHERSGQRVAVLVDEYDKPILDALGTPELARAHRDALRGLYSAIKFSDAHVKFTLLTGVSKFSKVGIFSGLNNLKDVTLDPRYSAICGYTDTDLDTVFAPELPGLDRDEIRRWYNGYGWRGGEKLYNPFDILLLFRSFFAGIPYQWHVKNDVARYEGYYASVFYSWFAATGLDVRVEDSASRKRLDSRGRLDMAVLFNDQVYLFELKTVEKEPEGSAMAQLAEKGYADKYRSLGQPIHLVGVEFSREERNVAAFAVERA